MLSQRCVFIAWICRPHLPNKVCPAPKLDKMATKKLFKTNPPDSELGREVIKKRNFPVLNYAFFSL